MNNILTIGHTGFLGSYLKERFNTQGWPGRFEWQGAWWKYAASDMNIDTIFYCARACRRDAPRRDRETVILDTKGIMKTCYAFPNTRIFYCSTKVVDGWTSDWERPVSREKIGDYFERALNGEFANQTIHLPEISEAQLRKFPPREELSEEHLHYARSKSVGETLVKSCAKDYTIFRIWDITQ